MDQIGWDGMTREYAPVEEIDIDSFDIEAWIRAKGLGVHVRGRQSPGGGLTRVWQRRNV